MNDRKEMIDFALTRMAGFTLEGSSDGDNRTIFSLIKTLLQSAHGDTLAECRKPLVAVLSIKVQNPKIRFQGCKLMLLQKAIGTMFGDSNNLLSNRDFAGEKRVYDRDMLLEYLEVCRRIFVTKYTPTTNRTDRD